MIINDGVDESESYLKNVQQVLSLYACQDIFDRVYF